MKQIRCYPIVQMIVTISRKIENVFFVILVMSKLANKSAKIKDCVTSMCITKTHIWVTCLLRHTWGSSFSKFSASVDWSINMPIDTFEPQYGVSGHCVPELRSNCDDLTSHGTLLWQNCSNRMCIKTTFMWRICAIRKLSFRECFMLQTLPASRVVPMWRVT